LPLLLILDWFQQSQNGQRVRQPRRLDGIDISAWKASERGAHIGYLPQDVELFHVSVRNNISRMDTPDDERVIAAARQAGVHDMILGLPQGYDTVVGPMGVRLSGGQCQRIGLARAMYGEPVLLVLDEPSSNLDLEGETALHDSINQIKARGGVIVLIEHRPRIFNGVEKALILKDGGRRPCPNHGTRPGRGCHR
jgi:ABC-type protease/lipase transport system fused ATPase/permease subunit